MNIKITAKDFFLHLGAIATFYASVIALTALLFEVIDYAYPKVVSAYQYFPSISLQVATLIVAFPLFLFLSWLIQKAYTSDPSLRESSVRRFLAYVTLFIAGSILAGNLITVIYMFLDGRDLTAGFLLKVLSLIVIMGGVFTYYLREIRNLIGTKERNGWRVASVLVILIAIILGFSVIGSPATQRAYRYDGQKTDDLQTIQWQLVNYWQQKQMLPATLDELEDPISGWTLPTDPQTNEPYTYKKTGYMSFQLCANFNHARGEDASTAAYPMAKLNENWAHAEGIQCFDRTIDPELYPFIRR